MMRVTDDSVCSVPSGSLRTGAVAVPKIATSEPGLTKPATRSKSVSSTDIAIRSSGITRLSTSPTRAEAVWDDLLTREDGAKRYEVT